ncbi:MAG: hypothetical protein Athens101428_653 [Candidatus Berkelbacteria bacterium Athens1014_28]|uniref:L,D-TPase catalytic domain-containing protein n=1 Tax=Candidatus Berkelbacteria bacterium Athens1014_28 TaxID=2017145 RepID=A0A554LKY8_9BACT|nr:MAG: hypothetical protein Athens101428_653 [Candidatus Berkelbacteria bacterium Athens1014_28]
MKNTLVILLIIPVFAVISGCQKREQIASTNFDTFVLPKPRVELKKVIVNNKPLVSDEVHPKTKPQIALVPPIQKTCEQSPVVDIIVIDLDSQTLFAYDDENQDRELKAFFISGAGPIEKTDYIMDLPLSHRREISEFPPEVRKQVVEALKKTKNHYLSELPHNHLGTFTIIDKDIDHYSDAFRCPMHYALNYFEGHYIHSTEPKYYSKIGQPASHGCIREREENAIWLYAHSRVGTKVVIERSSSKEVELVSRF